VDDGTLEAIQNLTLLATLWLTGIGLGMQVRLAEVVRSLQRRALVARTVVLDVLLVPAAMWLAVRLLVQDEGYATGLLLVAFAAAGPLGLKLAQVMRADAAYAIGIVVVLEASNTLLVPLWAASLGITASTAVTLDIVRTLVAIVLLPLAVGMIVRRVRPEAAVALGPICLRMATVGLAVVVGLVIVRNVGTMSEALSNGAAVAAVVVVVFALAAGWALGGPERGTRLSTSVVTGVRANAAALAVAGSTFADQPAVLAGVVTAGLVSVTLPTLMAYVVAWRAAGAAYRLAEPS